MKWKAGLFDKYVNARYLGRWYYNTSCGRQPKLKDTFITESLPNFAEFTLVEAATPQQQLRTIYIGRLDGHLHYVSTKHICPMKRGTLEVPGDAPKTFDASLHDNSGCDNTIYKSKQSVDQFWQKRAKYMRAYRTNHSAYAKQKEASCKTSARLNQTPEAR